MTEKTGRDEFYLFVNLFEELELILERLSSVLGVDVQKRLIVQILQTCNEPGMTNSFDRLSEIYHIGPDVWMDLGHKLCCNILFGIDKNHKIYRHSIGYVEHFQHLERFQNTRTGGLYANFSLLIQ